MEKSRQAILDNYYNQAKQGTLLDSSDINQTLSQAWLNAKNKVNKVTEQSEQTNLNNRLSVLGVLTQAEIDRAKAFVKAYQDNQARLEEEKKRAEEAKRKAEEERRGAEQAKEQERIQALFKDAQNLVQQAKDFANNSQSLVDNGRTNDVATLNKNLTERKRQAQASIDKLPNNATKALLQRQLNEITLVKANGGVNNPPNTNTPLNNTGTNNTPNIPTPIKPQEPKDKLELYKEQANVTKPQPEYRPDLIKKPEKPVELQRNDDFVNTQTFNTNNQKPVFLTQSELSEVDNLFYEIDTSGENINSFINFIENGITPKTYLQLGIGELEKSIQQLDNTLMQNAIGRIQNLQVTTSYKAEDALLAEGVNSAVAKKWGLNNDEAQALITLSDMGSYSPEDVYNTNSSIGGQHLSPASRAKILAFLATYQQEGYVILDGTQNTLNEIAFWNKAVGTVDFIGKSKDLSLNIYKEFVNNKRVTMKVLKDIDEITTELSKLVTEEKPTTMSNYTAQIILGKIAKKDMPKSVIRFLSDAITGSKDKSTQEAIKDYKKAIEMIRYNAILAQKFEQQKTVGNFFKKASYQDKLKFIAQQAIIGHESNNDVSWKWKTIYTIKKIDGLIWDDYKLQETKLK